MTAQPPTPPGTQGGPDDGVDPPSERHLRGGLFRHHDFRQLFLADTLSQFGAQLTGLALPVLAVKQLHANPLQMGLLGFCEFLAFLVIGLPAGAWVDRWRKQRVLILNDGIRALALASLPLAWALDVLTLTQLLVVALVMGSCTVFFDVAYQSYLPDLVEPQDISEGNAKLEASRAVSQIAGPAAAGGLIKLIGAPLTIGGDALSFVWSILWVRRIRHVDTPPPIADRRPLHVEIREGLAFVLRHPLLWRITACTSAANFFSSMTGTLLVIYALRSLDLDTGHLGLATGLGAIGGLGAAVVAPRVTRWLGEGRVIPVSALLMVPAGFLMPIAGTVIPSFVALAVYMLIESFSVVLYNVTQVSFRQRLCPRPLLGRMNASIRFLVWGVMPIGSLVGGFLGQAIGVRNVWWIGAVGAIFAILPVLLSPLVGMRDLPRELDRLS